MLGVASVVGTRSCYAGCCGEGGSLRMLDASFLHDTSLMLPQLLSYVMETYKL